MERRDFLKYISVLGLATVLPLELSANDTNDGDFIYYKFETSKLDFIEYFKIPKDDYVTFKKALESYKEANKRESTFLGTVSIHKIDGIEPVVLIEESALGNGVKLCVLSKADKKDITKQYIRGRV